MTERDVTSGKEAKKLAKASQKAAKKVAAAQRVAAAPDSPAIGGDSPAERAARAAEQKVALERWRTWLAAIGVLLAILTLIATIWWRS